MIALDLPGHGESGNTCNAATWMSLSQACWPCSITWTWGACLAGHSMGGAVALNLARLAPARVQSLSLIASAGLGRAINGGYLQGVAAANRNALKAQMTRLVLDPGLVTRQMLEDMLRFKRLEGVDEALRQLADALASDGVQRLRSAPGGGAAADAGAVGQR